MKEVKYISANFNYITKLFKKRVNELCEKRGISGTYFKIIIVLGKLKKATQKEIVNECKISAPTISLTLKKMEQEGLIERVVDINDQRNTIVCFSEAGKKLDDEIRDVFRKEEENLQNILSDDELMVLEECLGKITKYLEDKNESI